MKMKLLTICVLLFVGVSFAASAQTDVTWGTDLASAIQEAKSSGKKVLIDFDSETCSWCKKIKKEIFETEDFKTIAKDNFILVRINGPKDSGTCDNYGVDTYPTTIILDGDGKSVDRCDGYEPPSQYIPWVKGAGGKATSSGTTPGTTPGTTTTSSSGGTTSVAQPDVRPF